MLYKRYVSDRKKGRTEMKIHKTFAWLTVVCFCVTMISGYKKK